MKSTTLEGKISYVSWILGQTSALLGVILSILWGFELVFLRAQALYAQTVGQDLATSDGGAPPFGPALLGLGIALAGWLVAHLKHCRTPTPVFVGAAVNLLALVLAMLASAF
ncbi:hypothetical protein [Tautonia sociabilis]|uniref:Uncharacterized protein n=1 Tax=Tautonia sociabilis TaxID=2080755 RepID=A0A432MEZ7_9BACT|nr:hypothetical protein [Tautonia sociabilis]RUL84335.1 hypothetical protein TsocGM_20620 [Tautonia sociabilis]